MLVAVQLSVVGSYLPPVFKAGPFHPPQMIISLPVQTAVWLFRAEGALVRLVGVQVSSVQPPDGLDITGSTYLALTAASVTGTRASTLATEDGNGLFSHAVVVSL